MRSRFVLADRQLLDQLRHHFPASPIIGFKESAEAIGTLLNQANGIVTRLTSLIHNRFKTNPDKVHAWKQASRIERAPRKKQPAPAPEPTPEPEA